MLCVGPHPFSGPATVERFNEGVIGRFPRAAEDELHPPPIGPGIQGLGDELGAIVHTASLGTSGRGRHPLQQGRHMGTGQRCPDRHGGTHSAHVIHERQDPEAAPIGQPIAQEIHAPFRLRPGRHRPGNPRETRALRARFAPQGQPFRSFSDQVGLLSGEGESCGAAPLG